MNKSILIFGVGKLQKSLIIQAKKLGLFTIGIDPDRNAECNQLVDVFKIIGGDDYKGTLEVAITYKISGIITSATDKPLVMMARIAEALNLPFISVDSATISTDKYLMKNAFSEGSIASAKGKLVKEIGEIEGFRFPAIIKPRDNSGSRGVIYCDSIINARKTLQETKGFTKKESVLLEEYIEGDEYSIESLHYGGESYVIQYTEKITTSFPYNVELGHNQPANITYKVKDQIQLIISKIARALNFNNCASHTELKINSNGIFVIETSPRLGGDFITSHLVPLSTGINMEQELLKIAIGEQPNLKISTNEAAIVRYFDFKLGKVQSINLPKAPNEMWDSMHFSIDLDIGDIVPEIKNSLSRYGEIVFKSESIDTSIKKFSDFLIDIESRIIIEER